MPGWMAAKQRMQDVAAGVEVPPEPVVEIPKGPCPYCKMDGRDTVTENRCRDCDAFMCERHLYDSCTDDCQTEHSHLGVCATCFKRGENSFREIDNQSSWSQQMERF